MSAVIGKIISLQSSFTVSENEIAQYVMKNAEEVVASSITAIARHTNTSEASINRFCKKIGFKGFNSFKIALAQENFYNTLTANEEPREDAGYITRISTDYRQMLHNTVALLDEETVQRAVSCLEGANDIFIFAHASTVFIARELELKLQMIGLGTRTVTDPNLMRIFAAGVKKGSMVVAIVSTILVRDVYQALSVCKENGGHILIITNADSAKLDGIAEFKFVIGDKIIARNSLSLSNNLLFLFVIDILYAALLDRNKELRQKKRDSDTYFGMSQALDNYLLEY